jgi:3-phenylpropionate/trans-cinnamate dioxygenase ferredoxin reductase component
MANAQPHVIVGGGLAGAKTAEKLRDEGFEGPIVLIGDEAELPYERPPLSKDYLRGEVGREEPQVHPEDWYRENEVELRTETVVERIDVEAREVIADGERLGFEHLLIATGAEPRSLPVPGADLDGVYYLRELRDSDRLAEELGNRSRLVVVGAGWIGAEVAASARQKGLEVTMLERAKLPLETILGPEIGEIYADIHRDHAVELMAEAQVEGFRGGDRVEAVTLAGGAEIETDFVVIGIGVTPRTGLAERAGLEIDNGIAVDQRLETSVRGIFAAGDVANAFHPFYGGRLRVEHWANALHQPEVAARAMLGKEASYDRLPYFFSDQYDVGMEYAGYATEWDEVVFRGDVASREFIAFWLSGGRVVAGMNVNIWEVTDEIQALIATRGPVEVDRLRDPDVPLTEVGVEASA